MATDLSSVGYRWIRLSNDSNKDNKGYQPGKETKQRNQSHRCVKCRVVWGVSRCVSAYLESRSDAERRVCSCCDSKVDKMYCRQGLCRKVARGRQISSLNVEITTAEDRSVVSSQVVYL